MASRVNWWFRAGLVCLFAVGLFYLHPPVSRAQNPDIEAEETAQAVSDEVSPCYDGTTGPLRDCTLSERIADKNGFVYIAWQSTRVIINLILILALLVISFSNILRINIDTYTVKKALPNLVIGVILANASFLIIRYMADIATVAVYLFVNQTSYPTFKDFVAGVLSRIGIETLQTIGPAFGLTAVLAPIVVLLVSIISMIGILWLAFLLYFRLVAIYLLTILAPLAFVSYGLPGFEKYFKQWWQQFVKWLFILPAMSAVFWVMYVVATAGEQSIAKTIIQFFLFFTALALPSKMGGAVIDRASQMFKKTGNLAVDKTGVKDLGRDIGSRASSRLGITRLQEWNKLRKENLESAIKNRQTFAAGRARRGWAGRSEARLANEGVIAGDDLATIKAQNEERYFESPKGKEQLQRAIKSELEKRSAEAARDNTRLEVKIDYTGDKANEDLMKRLYKNLFSQKRASDELELSESIAIGDEAFGRIQILRAAEEYGRLKKKIDTQDYASEEEKQQLEIDLASQEKTFASLQKDPDNTDFLNREIGKVADELKDKKTTQGRLWAATLGRGSRIVNDGIAKQNEQTLKEGSAAEIREMMEEFFRDIDADFSDNPAKAREMKQLFLKGKTAEFQHELDALKASGKKVNTKMRNGLLATQAQKWVIAKPNDYRNQEVLEDVIDRQMKILDEADQLQFVDKQGEIKLDQLGDRKMAARAGRIIANKSGAHAGPEAKRVRSSFRHQDVPTSFEGDEGGVTGESGPRFTQEDVDFANQNLGGGVGSQPNVRPSTQQPTAQPPVAEEEDENLFVEDDDEEE